MKKMILMLSILFLSLFFINNNKDIEIPNDSIRLRIIADSNNKESQDLKLKIKSNIEKELENILKYENSYVGTLSALENDKLVLDEIVRKTMFDNNTILPYSINIGYNMFPEKKYNGVKYKEGYYESLVISIGEAAGNNWWCVIYPPLCNIEQQKIDSKNYQSIIWNIIKKYK